MHIAIDARIINSSTGTYVERLLYYLQKIDTTNSYTVLIPTKDRDFWRPTSPNFSVQCIDIPNYSWKEQTEFKKILDELVPDLVHFCMPQQPLLYRGQKVTTVHDLTLLKTYNSDKNWLVFHAKQLIGKAVFWTIGRTNAHIITPSQYTKDDYIRFARIPSKKVTVTYEAADVSPGTTVTYEHPFDNYILYVGQQSDYKNIRRLAEAHQLLLQKKPNLGLILVGKKNAAIKANEAYFTKKKYRNIHFTDYIPNEQRDWLYQNCSAYIFPSLMEGFGLPGLEAMAYGAPVISSNATCLPEVYGDTAMYFDPKNVIKIADTIISVLDDEPLRKNMIKKGYAQVAKYSWKKMAEETLAVYQKTNN